jgi:hypothetical protein
MIVAKRFDEHFDVQSASLRDEPGIGDPHHVQRFGRLGHGCAQVKAQIGVNKIKQVQAGAASRGRDVAAEIT